MSEFFISHFNLENCVIDKISGLQVEVSEYKYFLLLIDPMSKCCMSHPGKYHTDLDQVYYFLNSRDCQRLKYV